MLDLPADFQMLDDRLAGALKIFTPPEDMASRVIKHLQRRSRMTISPRVVQSAAAVAAVLVIGTFGYFADQQLNPVKSQPAQISSASATWFSNGHADFVAGDKTLTSERNETEGIALGRRFSKTIQDFDGDHNGDQPHQLYAARPRMTADNKPAEEMKSEVEGKVSDQKFYDEYRRSSGTLSLNNSPARAPSVSPAARESEFYSFKPAQSTRQDADRWGATSSNGRFAGFRFGLSDSDKSGKLGVTKSEAHGVELRAGVGFDVQSNSELKDSEAITTGKQLALADSKSEPASDSQSGQQGQQMQQVVQNMQHAEPARRVIRTGNMEFEVESFDSSIMTITKLVTEDGGFVANTDSAKLPNGKTRGQITLRVLPERLDALVLKLRGLGDLKTQKISSQDVSKAYTDIESGLRAARAMEKRLLEMIEKGNGAIKDLLAAEKELGVWREKIEQMEGEKRFYDNQISLSTLTITLQERDIKAAAGAIENERISTGVETDDVEKSRAEILKTLDSVGGRVLTSDMKKLDAGQFAANITAEVAPEKSGEVIDRLKQLGKIARLDVDRRQTTVDGQGTPAPGAHIEKKPTLIAISIYNLANVAPRLTTTMTLASNDVEASYKQMLLEIEKSGGRAVSSQLQRPRSDQVIANLQIECPSAKAAELQNALKSQGETMNLQLTENPDTANVTTAKTGYSVQIISATSVAPRETSSLQLAAADVAAVHKSLNDAAGKLGARVMQSSLADSDQNNLVSSITLEIPRSLIDDFDQTLAKSGDVLKRSVSRSSDTQNTIDSKVRLDLTIYAANRLPARESTTAVIHIGSADKSQAAYAALAQQLGGRVIDQGVNRDPNGRNSSRITIDVPRDKASSVLTSLRTDGDLWSLNTSSNPQAPDGSLARARFDLTFAEGEALVTRESGLWQSFKDGLSTSLRGLGWSVQILIVGLCLVAPWVLILWGAWKLLRKRKLKTV